MRRLILFEKMLSKLEEFIVTILMGAIVILQFLQVLFRYALHNPLGWTEELARFSFIWLIMIGSAVGLRRGLHFTVTFLVRTFPARLQAACSFIVSVSLLAFLLIAFRYGIKLVSTVSGQITPALEIPTGVPYSSIAVGACLMLFHVIAHMARSIMGTGLTPQNDIS